MCFFDVTVEDGTPPTVACDQTTKVGLSVDGMAFVNATTFDDGSYDNCSPVYFKARRMNPNGRQDDSQFHYQVKFAAKTEVTPFRQTPGCMTRPFLQALFYFTMKNGTPMTV